MLNSPEAFEVAVKLSATKFEHLITKQLVELGELHESIALLADEREAERVTGIRREPGQAIAKAYKSTDDALETAWKWGGRILRFAPWIEHVFRVKSPI